MDNLKRIGTSWIFWVGVFSIVVLGGLIYLVIDRGFESTIIRQLLSKQQIIARAEESNLQTYLRSFGNSVALLAQLSSVERRTPSAADDLQKFLEQKRSNGVIGGILLTNSSGIVQFNANIVGTNDVGVSVADREFFIWAKTRGERAKYHISEPIIGRDGGSRGQPIVAVASPVYQNEKFTGVVIASVKLQVLIERFFGIMKISDQTKVYLVSKDGNLFYNNSNPDKNGSKILDFFGDDQNMTASIERALRSMKEGNFQTEKQLVSYRPITIGNQTWLLFISSPIQEVEALTRQLYIQEISIMVLIAFTILLFGALAIRRNYEDRNT